MDYRAMAQRWHDTDHGDERGKPLKKTKFIVPVEEPEPDWVSPCFCCCVWCRPSWGPRPNPFWSRVLIAA